MSEFISSLSRAPTPICRIRFSLLARSLHAPLLDASNLRASPFFFKKQSAKDQANRDRDSRSVAIEWTATRTFPIVPEWSWRAERGVRLTGFLALIIGQILLSGESEQRCRVTRANFVRHMCHVRRKKIDAGNRQEVVATRFHFESHARVQSSILETKKGKEKLTPFLRSNVPPFESELGALRDFSIRFRFRF